MKKVVLSLLLFGLLAGVVMVAAPQPGYACSCAEPGTPEDALKRADAVFTGRVIEVKETRTMRGFIAKTVLFEVEQTWKGMSDSQVIVHTGSGGGDCGYPFQEGREYLVYGYMSDMYSGKEELTTGICGRTKELAQAGEDMDWLGAGSEPQNQVDLKSGLRNQQLYVWTAAVVVIAALIGLLVRKRRGRRS